MFKINKLIDKWFILLKDWVTIKTIFNDWKIWLTKNEIWKLFKVEKSIITENIKNIFFSNQYDIENDIEKIYNKTVNKKETYYSLDIIISLWYRFNSYKNTRFIINYNNTLKKRTTIEDNKMYLEDSKIYLKYNKTSLKDNKANLAIFNKISKIIFNKFSYYLPSKLFRGF